LGCVFQDIEDIFAAERFTTTEDDQAGRKSLVDNSFDFIQAELVIFVSGDYIRAVLVALVTHLAF